MSEKQTEPIDRDSRDLLIVIDTKITHMNESIDILSQRVNKREQEIDETNERVDQTNERVHGIEKEISGFRGQMIMLKILGGFIGLLLAGLEVYRLFNP